MYLHQLRYAFVEESLCSSLYCFTIPLQKCLPAIVMLLADFQALIQRCWIQLPAFLREARTAEPAFLHGAKVPVHQWLSARLLLKWDLIVSSISFLSVLFEVFLNSTRFLIDRRPEIYSRLFCVFSLCCKIFELQRYILPSFCLLVLALNPESQALSFLRLTFRAYLLHRYLILNSSASCCAVT